MAQRLSTSFINTNIPGSYVNTTVKSTPVGIGATGVVAIIGEADGGDDFSLENIKENFFGPSQVEEVSKKYLGGPIVEAMRALASSSNDANIIGSINRVYVVKSNGSTKASALVDTDYGTLSAKIGGFDGNNVKFRMTASQSESAPSVNSTAIDFGTPANLDGLSFTMRVNGGVATVVTLSATTSVHDTRPELVVELNALLPANITAVAGAAAADIVIFHDADSVNYRKGWGKSFELIDSTPGDLAFLGLSAGLIVSGAESNIDLEVVRAQDNTNESFEAKGEVALTVGYQGTTATLTIASNTLTTTVVGGSGANLSIDISKYSTIKDLADFISSQTGYSASAISSSNQAPTSELDKVAGISICSTAASLKPGRVKKSLSNFNKVANRSAAVAFVATETEGLPSPSSFAFLANGAKGSTTGADIIDALAAIEGVAVNFVIPLFSRDASADIADGITESSSTYTIDAIHAASKNHVLKLSTPALKRNRQAALACDASYVDAKEKAQSLAAYRCTQAFQKSSQVDSEGAVQMFASWHSACIAVGMQAAGFYKSITNKLANVISYQDPSGFDSGNPTDVSDALDAGLLILQSDTAGVKWVSDQTTYGQDTNFVYNSMQAVYCADIVTLDLAESVQRRFVGQSLADIDIATVEGFLAAKMEEYKRLKLIAASDDAPLGYVLGNIKINGPIMEISVSIRLATAIYFVPINLEISQVQLSS